MDPPFDFSPSPICKVCGDDSTPGSYLCIRCRHLLDRNEVRKDSSGGNRHVDRGARLAAMAAQWDRNAGAFLCAYTKVALNDDYPSPRHASWEHRTPGDESSVVLVADRVNKMKCYLTEAEFERMVRALYMMFEGQGFDPSAFPTTGMLTEPS